MLFRRKKDVDLRELQRRGVIRIPKESVEVETDRNGFVDLSNTSNDDEPFKSSTFNSKNSENLEGSSGGEFFNFFDSSSQKQVGSSSSFEQEKREMTRKFEEMDNKIYKLEQRIELLERKAGVGSSSGYSWQ